MILHTKTGEDDKKDVKDRTLETFWCKFHYIYLSAFLCHGKRVLVSMCQEGLMMSGKKRIHAYGADNRASTCSRRNGRFTSV